MTSVTEPTTGADPRRPRRLTPREQTWGLLSGVWMVSGLFLDGWAHDDGRPESFFTPWHGVLYSGFAVATLVALQVIRGRRRERHPIREAVPPGHGLTLIGLAGFGLAGFGDLVWHEVFGIEVAVEALLSPTHLMLLVSGLLALSAPLRAAWAAPISTDPDGLRGFLPIVLGLVLLVAVTGFFLAYLSPFVNDAAGQGFDPTRQPHEHPSVDVGELRQLLGLASILVTTVLLTVPVHLLIRRWRVPNGTVSVLLGASVLLLAGLDRFDQAPMALAAVAGGATADLVRHRWPMATVPVAMGVFWTGYFALYQVTQGGVAWSAELTGGTTVLTVLVAAGVGLVRFPVFEATTTDTL